MEALLGLGYFAALVVMAVLSFYFISRNNLRYTDGISWNWPIVGMLPFVISNLHHAHDKSAECLNRLGSTLFIKGPLFCNVDMLLTVDPANVRHMLIDSCENFSREGDIKPMLDDVFGDGLVNIEDELWRKQRKLVQNMFNHHPFLHLVRNTSQDKIKHRLLTLIDHVCKQENNDQVVDMQEVFQRLTFDVSCIFVTGYDPGSLSLDFPDVPFLKAMEEAQQVMTARNLMPTAIWKFLRFLNMGTEKKLWKALKIIDHVLYTYISRKRKELSTAEADLLTLHLIHDDDEDDNSLGLDNNDKLVRDMLINLILAGKDSTSSALTWFLWLVITHPQVLAKIRQEVEEAIAIPQNESTKLGQHIFRAEELSHCNYLHAAISETLRLYPPFPFIYKVAVKSDTLPSGHHVVSNSKVIVSLYAMGRIVDIWGEDCREFKPERWIYSKDGRIKNVAAHKIPTFGAGPHACLGKKMAYNQMKEVAATLIHNYDFQLVDGHPPVTPNFTMVLLMQDGLKVRVTNRWSSPA